MQTYREREAVAGGRGVPLGRRRDYTRGSIARNLLSLSWPMIVGNSVNMIGPTIDMIWVGRLGPDAIAGVGVSGIAVMLAQSGLMGLFQGLRSMVARFIGAGEEEKANHVAQQAIVLGVASSIVLALIGVFFAEGILQLVGVDPEVVAVSAGYLRIQFIGMTAMSFRMMAESIMQASGDSVTPMKIAVVFRILHVVLSPVLIFGLWVFPKFGVNGAAITNVFSQTLGTGLGFWILFKGNSRLKLSFKRFRIDPGTVWKVVRIGLPASVMGMQQNLGQFLLMFLVAPFGTLAVAAHTLNQRIEMFMFMPAWGVGMAAGVLSGQNLGARQPDRAEKSGWIGTALVEGFVILCSICILIWAETFVHVFSSDPELVAIGATFLRIAVAGYLVTGFIGVLQNCISGAGDTIVPMVVSLLAIWLVMLPLAFFLSKQTALGVYGIRWAIVASSVANAVCYTVYFRMGRWKRKEI
jgi:putative MATE family efflux protein